MLPLLLALAHAAAIPGHPGPYRVEQVDSSDIRVYDDLGDRVPTEVVLRAVEGDAVADDYRTRRGGRKAAAVLMWVAGGVAATVGTLGLGGDDSGLSIGLGAASTGAGFLTLYAPRTNRLDRWTTEEAIQAWLQSDVAPAAGSSRSEGPGAPPAEPWALVAGLPTVSGEAIPVPDLAAALGDARVAEDWERWRTSRRRTRTGLLVAGATLTVAGLATATNSGDRDEIGAGVATAAVGSGMMLGGTLGFGIRGPRASADAWFTPEALDEAVRLHNEGGASTGATEPRPPRAPLFTVAPTIGPGFAGLHGTF